MIHFKHGLMISQTFAIKINVLENFELLMTKSFSKYVLFKLFSFESCIQRSVNIILMFLLKTTTFLYMYNALVADRF